MQKWGESQEQGSVRRRETSQRLSQKIRTEKKEEQLERRDRVGLGTISEAE